MALSLHYTQSAVGAQGGAQGQRWRGGKRFVSCPQESSSTSLFLRPRLCHHLQSTSLLEIRAWLKDSYNCNTCANTQLDQVTLHALLLLQQLARIHCIPWILPVMQEQTSSISVHLLGKSGTTACFWNYRCAHLLYRWTACNHTQCSSIQQSAYYSEWSIG